MTDDLSRCELEHHAPPATPLRITECPQELSDLANAQPGHDIWAERLPGMTQLKYVARRRQGTDAHPYLIVTSDLAELRDALRPDPPSQEDIP
jgi:hypothetical protein